MTPFWAVITMVLPVLLSGLLIQNIQFKDGALRLILAFSASYLFALTIMHMLPEVYNGPFPKLAGLFIVCGFCLQLVLDAFSTGIEHGHIHTHTDHCHKQFPKGISIGLMIHSFLEGLPVFDPQNPIEPIHANLIVGLGIHHIPITITFMILLKDHGLSILKRQLWLVALSVMGPLGMAFGFLIHDALHAYSAWFSATAYAVVIGIFLHISTAILFESSEGHRYTPAKIFVLLLGVLAAFVLS